MDRGAWWATGHRQGHKELDTIEAIQHSTTEYKYWFSSYIRTHTLLYILVYFLNMMSPRRFPFKSLPQTHGVLESIGLKAGNQPTSMAFKSLMSSPTLSPPSVTCPHVLYGPTQQNLYCAVNAPGPFNMLVPLPGLLFSALLTSPSSPLFSHLIFVQSCLAVYLPTCVSFLCND